MKKQVIKFYECNNGDFAVKYRSAYSTLVKNKENKEILEMLIDTYNDEKELEFIKMANDYFEYAPVRSWLMYHKNELDKYNYTKNGKIGNKLLNKEVKKAIRSVFWMGFAI